MLNKNVAVKNVSENMEDEIITKLYLVRELCC